MKVLKLETLIVDDNDLECKNDKTSLTDLSLNNLNFKFEDIERFELIIYRGTKGTKVLKSSYFRTGKIVG
jgi:hypothetical protein